MPTSPSTVHSEKDLRSAYIILFFEISKVDYACNLFKANKKYVYTMNTSRMVYAYMFERQGGLCIHVSKTGWFMYTCF